MNKDEPLRAGKIMSDYCKCGHLKNEHELLENGNVIRCTKGCGCELRFD